MKTKTFLTIMALFISAHIVNAQEITIEGTISDNILFTGSQPNNTDTLLSDWEIIEHTGSRQNFIDVHFVDNDHGWIVADLGTIIYTHDRGLSWEERFLGASIHFSDVHFIDKNTGFVSGTVDMGPYTKGICYKTSNGGNSWEMIYLSDGSMNLKSMTFANDLKGYIIGHTLSPNSQEGIILKTEDGGSNWELLSQNPLAVSFDKLMFSDETTGWMTGRMDVGPGEVSVVYKTEDSGENWNVVYYSHTETGMQSVDFFDSHYGMATGDDGSVYITYDSGHTWEAQNKRQFSFNDLTLGSDGQAWLVGEDGVNLNSSDYGKNWVEIITPLNTDLNSICTTPGGYLWVVGDEGTLYFQAPKEIDDGDNNMENNDREQKSLIASGLSNEDVKQTGPFIGHKNYPNPFTGQTTISFELDQTVDVQLHVYSLNGQLIETLLDQSVEAGSHKVRFAAQNLPSGIYTYSLTAGSTIEYGKMILNN